MRDFNFFLPYLHDKKERKNKKAYIAATLIVVAIIVLGTFIYNSFYIFTLKGDIKDLKNTYEAADNQQQLAKAEGLIKTYNILNDYNKELEDIFAGVLDRKVVSSQVLFDISNSIPKEVSFKNMSLDGSVLSIQGISSSRVAVAELGHNLKVLSYFGEVHIGNINLVSNEGAEQYSFSIKCTLKGVNNDEAK
ncbi:PilN domain-containing protein [Clostridium tunisiense]|uniref:PilN domain-containing protein n=1 Tax=Clostridium tunisiense TaxID=219748 RepID=UPI00031ADF9B|nr:PilN domain-containing protein [Clostridium tunisiense]